MSLIILFTPGDSQLFTNINISDLMQSRVWCFEGLAQELKMFPQNLSRQRAERTNDIDDFWFPAGEIDEGKKKQIWETEKRPCWAVKETATPSLPPRRRRMRGVKLQLWTRSLQLRTADTQSRKWALSGITSLPRWPNRAQNPRTPAPSCLTPSAGRCTAHPAQADTLPLSTWARYCPLPVSRLLLPAARISAPLTSSGRAPGASIRPTAAQGPASTI